MCIIKQWLLIHTYIHMYVCTSFRMVPQNVHPRSISHGHIFQSLSYQSQAISCPYMDDIFSIFVQPSARTTKILHHNVWPRLLCPASYHTTNDSCNDHICRSPHYLICTSFCHRALARQRTYMYVRVAQNYNLLV